MRSAVAEPADPEEIVSLARVKQHLKVDHSAEDDLIKAYRAAAIAHIDAPDGWLGRAIGVQQIDTWFDEFDDGVLKLPFVPLIDVLEVQYRAPITGAWIDVDPGSYELRGKLLGNAWAQTWPAMARGPETIRVRCLAGYEDVPAPIVSAILLMIGDLYRNRETTAERAAVSVPMSTTVENLLAPYRVWF